MILRFKDGKEINVRDVIGTSRVIFGTLRDSLRIEVDPSAIGLEELRALFKDNPNTEQMFISVDEAGGTTMKSVGEGYVKFVSISDEFVKVDSNPSVMSPDQYEEIYAVTIGQETYQEHMLAELSGRINSPAE